MKTEFNFSKAVYIFNIFILVLILYNLYFFLRFPHLGTDSGYYMATARDIYNGIQFFTEIATPYNPLSIVVVGLPFLLFDAPDVRLFLLINFILMLFSTKIFYNILKENFNNTKQVNLLFSLLLFLGFLIFDGKHILLEPLSVLFQLLALYVYLKNRSSQRIINYFITGVLLSLSFLSKQYGLFLLLPIVLDIIIFSRKRLISYVGLACGVILPLLMLYVYYAISGTSLQEYILYILGKGVEFDTGVGTGINFGLDKLLLSVAVFIGFNAYFLLIPLAFFKMKELKNKKSFIFIASAISSLSVLYFASYFHYYQYILPFFFLLSAYIFQFASLKTHKLLFFLSLAISLLLVTVYIYVSNLQTEKEYNDQIESVSDLHKIIPKDAQVYIVDSSKAYYFLGQYRSINSRKIGYSFSSYFFPKTIVGNLKPGSFLIVGEKSMLKYTNELKGKYQLSEMMIEKKKYIIVETIK